MHAPSSQGPGWGSAAQESSKGAHACPVCPQLRQLEMQLEQEYEEKQVALHEKHDLEGLIGTLCDQVRPHSGDI